jgi:23S rRNA (guanosine2251-2'-O)-methyltransferase
MTSFEVRQCTNPACGLRTPIDPGVNQGGYCPRCGSPMSVVSHYHQYQCSGTRTRSYRISALLDNIRSAYNVGAIFRTADAAGVQHLYLCGITPKPGNNPTLDKTALGAEAEIPWSYHRNAYWTAKDLREAGYYLLGLECTPDALPMDQFHYESNGAAPLLLIVGNEKAGVDPDLLDMCDAVLSIPMLGKKVSLNVGIAFGIAAFWMIFSS